MLTVLWHAKNSVSFPLEDKRVENEHDVIRKSHDTTQKKYPHMVYSVYHTIGLKETCEIKLKT